ncbi:MAG: hypothetical protein H0T77_12595 [Pyrinomonadaceae bacterium]|nr:hypothetical protein [Pyrinomonadaceae bacterium]
MNSYCLRVVMKGAVLTVGIVLLSFSLSSARAQGSLPPSMSERERNLRDREMQVTLMEKGAKAPAKREPQLLLKEINEDFARLQVVNNEIKLKASANPVLDFKYVSDAATEIKKRSSRLRANLVFPDSAESDKREKPLTTEGLKSQLVTLDRLIRSFVTNRVFTDAGVINAELAAKARGDLDEIIDLSDTVKKRAANLHKAKANSH